MPSDTRGAQPATLCSNALRPAVLLLLAAAAALAAPPVRAQHETAFDIEDGSASTKPRARTVTGPDGDLIAGIDFGRGVFRRPMTDDELAHHPRRHPEHADAAEPR